MLYRGNDFVYKVVVFGDANVGKSTLTYRAVEGTFRENIRKTIGVNCSVKRVFFQNVQFTLNIWDFSGEEKFHSLLPMYLRGADGGIFVFDLTNRQSLHNLDDWISVAFDVLGPNFPMIMVGSKSDLVEFREVKKDHAIEFARKYNFNYFESSAKEGINIKEIFDDIAKMVNLQKIIDSTVESKTKLMQNMKHLVTQEIDLLKKKVGDMRVYVRDIDDFSKTIKYESLIKVYQQRIDELICLVQ